MTKLTDLQTRLEDAEAKMSDLKGTLTYYRKAVCELTTALTMLVDDCDDPEDRVALRRAQEALRLYGE